MNTNTLQNYVSPSVTSQVTGNIVAVTSGRVVADGRIARHWKGKELNHRRFFTSLPKHINDKYCTDPASFVEYFKLHSVEFGNWLNQAERQEFMTAGADCLIQLSNILGVHTSEIGLNRKLSVSFGARGTGGVALAHYESMPYAIINISKPHADEGAFAHEFGHAIDNLTATYLVRSKKGYVTLDYDKNQHELAQKMNNIFFMLIGTKSEPTKFKIGLDKLTNYYKYEPEIFARTFEAMMFELNGKQYNKMFYENSYNANIYPDKKVLNEIKPHLMSFVKKAVNELNALEFPTPGPKKKIIPPLEIPKPAPMPEQEEAKPVPNNEPKEEAKEEKPKEEPKIGDTWKIKQNLSSFKGKAKTFVDIVVITDIGNKFISYKTENGSVGGVSLKTWEKETLLGNFIKLRDKPEPKEEKPKEEPKIEPKPRKNNHKIVVYGDDVLIVTPTQKLEAKFAIVDIDDLIQSNDPFTFSPNPMYPESCQTRDYRLVKGEQNKVIEYSAQFEPKHLLNNSPDATTGTIVINKDGVVLGGNGRTMILKRVFANFKDKYENYKNQLTKVSEILFGIKAEDLKDIKNPVAVRILYNAPVSECSKYSNILNQSNSQVYDEFQEGISIAKEILNNPYAYKNIALAIANQEAETVAEIFADKQLNAMIIDTLKSIKLINNANMDLYVDSKDYTITNRGRSILVNALLSSILPDKQLLTQADKYKNKLIATLPAWIKVNSLKNEFNIIPKLQKALRMEAQRKASKLPLRDFIAQIGAFSEETDVITIELLKILEYTKIAKFRDFARYYSERALENEMDNVFNEKIEPLAVIMTWVENNEVVGLSDRISWSSEKAVIAQAKFLFSDIDVRVSLSPDYVNIYHEQTMIGRIDLNKMLVIDNQIDMFGSASLSNYATRMEALLSYIKGLNKKTYVPQMKQDALFSDEEVPFVTPVPKNQNILFDKVKLNDNVILENLESIETLSDNNYIDDFSEPEPVDDFISLSDAQNVPLKPLLLPYSGKVRKLLTRLNSPFQMLVWGKQGCGKSSFLLTLLDELSVNGNCLLVITEETTGDGRIGERSKRMNIRNLNRVHVAEIKKLSELVDILDTGKYKFVAIDSKDCFEDEKYLLDTYFKYSNKGINFISVSHTIKDGSVNTGDRKYAYLCNTELYVNNDGVVTVLKHRDAPKGNSLPVFSQVKSNVKKDFFHNLR